jgi:hypothetical protein
MLREDLEDWEIEICQEIRKQMPEAWGDQDDKFIYNFCIAIPRIEELVCNKGFTTKDAVTKVFIEL